MTDTVAAAQLRAFVERIERIEADIKEMNADKSEVYKELRGVGFDVKAVRQCVAKRKLDDAERQEQDSLFDMYWGALTGGPRVHVHEEPDWGPGVGNEILPSEAAQDEPDGEADASGDFKRDMAQSVPAHLTDGNIVADGLSRSAHSPETASDEDVPAFLRKPVNIRPHCLHPELCAGYGRTHCGSCLKAYLSGG
jgi:uncharacterized protein (UPF0335 family)